MCNLLSTDSLYTQRVSFSVSLLVGSPLQLFARSLLLFLLLLLVESAFPTTIS